MIKAEFYKRDSMVTGYIIGGHAFFDVVGKDIVCAAVSALVITITNELADLVDNTLVVDEEKIIFEIKKDYQTLQIKCLVNALYNGLKLISEEYPINVEVVDHFLDRL